MRINRELIATRVPPGDKWTLKSAEDDMIYSGLYAVIAAYIQKTAYEGDFYFSRKEGKIYTVEMVEDSEFNKEEAVERASVDIYGDE